MSLQPHSQHPLRPPGRRPRFALKRERNIPGLLDRVLAAVLLVLLAPVILVVGVVVKLEAPRAPVLYKQERVGLNRRKGKRGQEPRGSTDPELDRRQDRGEGKLFSIWKFRTMVPDAESKTGPVWASDDDPRITRVGKILRKTRLDELPQLFNVIMGEMRLIGPRPERPYFVNQLADRVPGYRGRLNVPPGITGLAQVERNYDADMDDVKKKLRYDLFYIQHRRPIMDLKILFKTIWVVLTRRGAR